MSPHLICRILTAFMLTTGVGAHASAPLTVQATRINVAGKMPTPTGARGSKPVQTARGVAPGQAGYVHYFLLRMPDDTLEIQVGIELADQRIAWSFPGLGVVISPFIDGETVEAGDRSYGVWHLYGIRPHVDAAAMTRLQKELPARVDRWVKAGIPYCLDDAPRANCMSCLGLVLRALFPGRNDDYPVLPRDFWRAGMGSRYTPNDLLLYLTGMLDLPDRNARLQRINRLALPPDLRLDLEEQVYRMGVYEVMPTPQKRAAQQSPRRRL